MTEINLVNAYELHKLNPDSFYYPTNDELDNIQINDGLKVNLGNERFWTLIKEIKDNKFICEVSNNLIDKSQCDIGDLIVVKKENIYQIRKENERQKIIDDFNETLNNPSHIPKFKETLVLLDMMLKK